MRMTFNSDKKATIQEMREELVSPDGKHRLSDLGQYEQECLCHFLNGEWDFGKLIKNIFPHKMKGVAFLFRTFHCKAMYSFDIVDKKSGQVVPMNGASRTAYNLQILPSILADYMKCVRQKVNFWKGDDGLYYGSYQGKTYKAVNAGWLISEMGVKKSSYVTSCISMNEKPYKLIPYSMVLFTDEGQRPYNHHHNEFK